MIVSGPAVPVKPEIESALAIQIEPWLAHMRWRADFADWQQKRLWQENYQADAVKQVRAAHKVSPNGDAAHTARVLDLGAGMGGFAVAMQRAGERIVAFDYNLAYCEITRTRGQRYELNMAALVGAGEALPFASSSFHIVTCWDVLEHVQQPEKLLAEIARVLDADGVAFITVINRYALVDPHYHLRFVNYLPRPLAEKYIVWRQRTKDSALKDRQRLSEMHYYTYGGFKAFAARFGFTVEDLQRVNSRFRAYPRPIGDALYDSWRAFGMGTYRVMLRKNAAAQPTTDG